MCWKNIYLNAVWRRRHFSIILLHCFCVHSLFAIFFFVCSLCGHLSLLREMRVRHTVQKPQTRLCYRLSVQCTQNVFYLALCLMNSQRHTQRMNTRVAEAEWRMRLCDVWKWTSALRFAMLVCQAVELKRNNFNDIFHSRLVPAAYVPPQTKA